jgi:hypothetical protein
MLVPARTTILEPNPVFAVAVGLPPLGRSTNVAPVSVDGSATMAAASVDAEDDAVM